MQADHNAISGREAHDYVKWKPTAKREREKMGGKEGEREREEERTRARKKEIIINPPRRDITPAYSQRCALPSARPLPLALRSRSQRARVRVAGGVGACHGAFGEPGRSVS